MKFSEMTYTRPDIDALLARCKQLAAKAADAQDGDALIQVYYEQSRAFADYTTASQLANIHYTCDTRDAYWKAEQDSLLPYFSRHSLRLSSSCSMHFFLGFLL